MNFIQLPGDLMVNTVSFPGLGLEFTLNRVAIILFGRNVYWYGAIIGLGFLLAVLWCCRRAERFGIKQDDIFDLLIAEVPLCLIGCRAYYVMFNLSEYREGDGALDWARIVRISDGGIAIYGGVITAALVLWAFCRWKKHEFLPYADLGVQGLLIGQLIGRWGNFMNVEAYGGVTELPWRMCSPSIAESLLRSGLLDEVSYRSMLDGKIGVHPTFLYESLWNLVGLVLIYVISKKFYRFDGQLFLSYLFWYGLGRFWIEGLRTDSLYFFGLSLFGEPIRTSQAVALLSATVGGALLVWQLWFRRGQHRSLYVDRLAEKKKAEEEEEEEEKDHGSNSD